MHDYNKLAQAVTDAEAALVLAREAVTAADDGARPAAEVRLKTDKDNLDRAKAAWEAAVGGSVKKDLIGRFYGQNLVGCASFGVLLVLILIAWCLHKQVFEFLGTLAEVDITRGVISAIIVGVTALLAIILIFAAIGSTGADNEKSFNRGKEVFVVLVGICGTCVGYYFSQSTGGIRGLSVTGPQISYSEQYDNARIDAFVGGGRGPWQYEITWENAALPKVPATMTSNGGVTLNIPLPKDWKDKFTGKMTLRDASGLSQSLDFILQRAPAVPAPANDRVPNSSPNGAGGGATSPPAPPGALPLKVPAPPVVNPAAAGQP